MKSFARFCAAFTFCACVLGSVPAYSDEAAVAADVAAIHALLDRIEVIFKDSDIDAAMQVFTEDAVILADDGADVVGKAAIRKLYEDTVAQFNLTPVFSTADIVIAGDIAYEQGTYVLTLVDKASGQVASESTYRHIHIFKRQADGSWKTWRMMTNSLAPAAPVAQ